MAKPFQFKNYEPSEDDIRRAIRTHGREISLTKLAGVLTPVAGEHHFKFVDWHMMKLTAETMVRSGVLVKIRQPQGFYRYDLAERHAR